MLLECFTTEKLLQVSKLKSCMFIFISLIYIDGSSQEDLIR